MLVKLDHFPKRDKNKIYLKPPPSKSLTIPDWLQRLPLQPLGQRTHATSQSFRPSLAYVGTTPAATYRQTLGKTNRGGHKAIILPETNMAPENGWLEYLSPFGMAYFQG